MAEQSWKCSFCDPTAEDGEDSVCLRCHQTIEKMEKALTIFQTTKRGREFLSKYASDYLNDPLKELVGQAVAAFEGLPEEAKKKHRREQAISFVRGTLALSGKIFTYEETAKAYDDTHKEE